ncbi:MAG: hypothetical protein HOQ01_09725 [Lysobacter sp.]|nr:hypothetical protein [Lysobacter sp.]
MAMKKITGRKARIASARSRRSMFVELTEGLAALREQRVGTRTLCTHEVTVDPVEATRAQAGVESPPCRPLPRRSPIGC